MTDTNEMRRRRDRMRKDRQARLVAQLALQAQLLCESHDRRKQGFGTLGNENRALLGRMFRYLAELLRIKLDDSSRAALAAVFDQCKWREEQVTEISWSGNMIHLNGEFDMRELAKRLVWIGVAEHEKTVGEDTNE